MEVGWVLPMVWMSLGAVVVMCGLLAVRHPRAYVVAVLAVSSLWVVAGAGANAYFLFRGDTFSGFADGAAIGFVQDTWESLVVPHHHFWIGLLVAFEGVTGVLVLVEGRVRQVALALLVAFTVALLSFGSGYLVWVVPMTVGLVGLLRAGVVRSNRRPGFEAVTTSSPLRE